MAKHAPVVERSGNTVTVVAPTAQEAMAVVGDAAPGFRTTSIGKVRRGGLAGFFATELVRVVAEAPGADGPTCVDTPPRSTVAGRDLGPQRTPTGLRLPEDTGTVRLATADDLIASLCGADGPFAGGSDAAFADRLAAELQRSLLTPAPAEPVAKIDVDTDAVRPAPVDRASPAVRRTPISTLPEAPAPRAHVDVVRAGRPGPTHDVALTRSTEPSTEPTPGTPPTGLTAGVWSAAGLEAAGLPSQLVARVAAVAPQDDVTWNAAMMLALREWCGADLPTGDVIAGPAAAPIAEARHVAIVAATDVADRDGPVATLDADTAALAGGLAGRALHLVVGGAWRHLATARPDVVSAATVDDLIDAVRVAVAWDAPLGWVHDGTAPVRIDPFLVTAHVRTLLAAQQPVPRARRAPGRRAPRRAHGADVSASGQGTLDGITPAPRAARAPGQELAPGRDGSTPR